MTRTETIHFLCGLAGKHYICYNNRNEERLLQVLSDWLRKYNISADAIQVLHISHALLIDDNGDHQISRTTEKIELVDGGFVLTEVSPGDSYNVSLDKLFSNLKIRIIIKIGQMLSMHCIRKGRKTLDVRLLGVQYQIGMWDSSN